MHFQQDPPLLFVSIFGFILRQKRELLLCYCIK